MNGTNTVFYPWRRHWWQLWRKPIPPTAFLTPPSPDDVLYADYDDEGGLVYYADDDRRVCSGGDCNDPACPGWG